MQTAQSNRTRSVSNISIHKKIIRNSSEDKEKEKSLSYSKTATSFRPKLHRLIKEGRIQQILNTDSHSKANLYYNNHINEMEKELAVCKKLLSSMVIQSKSKEYHINKLKNDIKKAQKQSILISKQSHLTDRNYRDVQTHLAGMKEAVADNFWVEKIYAYKKSQLKCDENLLKTKYDYLQQRLQKQEFTYKSLYNRYHQLSKLNIQLRNVEAQARKLTKKETQEKNEFIKLLSDDMVQRQMLGKLKKDKDRRAKQIQELTSSQIQREEEQKYMNIFWAHRILSQILKCKNNKLMKKYQEVQRAYLYIKSHTNIADMDKIVQRMEEQDQLYENALRKINILEAENESLEEEIKDVSKLRSEALSQGGSSIGPPKNYYKGHQKDRNELLLRVKERLQDSRMEDEVLLTKIKAWCNHQFQQYNISIPEQPYGSQQYVRTLEQLISKAQ